MNNLSKALTQRSLAAARIADRINAAEHAVGTAGRVLANPDVMAGLVVGIEAGDRPLADLKAAAAALREAADDLDRLVAGVLTDVSTDSIRRSTRAIVEGQS